MPRWTTRAINIAKRMWLADDHARAIAMAIGVTENAVWKKAKKEGWPRRGPPPPPRRPIWAPDTSETARRMWLAGDTVPDIAMAIGISRNAVSEKAKKEGWPRRPSPRSSIWTSETSETAKQMWLAGETAHAIAKAIGASRNAVLGKAWREGWPHQVKSPWTPGAIETAKHMWFVGDTASTIAKVIGIKKKTVQTRAWREG
jgi:hypothetical protein